MITVISGTNRANSNSSKIALLCKQLLEEKNKLVHLVDLADVKDFGVVNTMYSPENQSSEVAEIQDQHLMPADKWVLILAEYNGGVPGIFKLLIDAISVRNKDGLKGKEVLLIGVAAGRAGNLRGLDYMTNCLNYLGMKVHPQKMPISLINKVLSDGKLEEHTHGSLKSLLENFAK